MQNVNQKSLNKSLSPTRRNAVKLAGIIAGSTLSATSVSGQSTIEIEDWNDLNNVRNDINANYLLVNDLTSQTEGYEDHIGESKKGWKPIGKDFDSAFQGTFDGNGHKILDLIINRPDESNVGLFGATRGVVKNISVLNADITGDWNAGALVGFPYENIYNSFADGTVMGRVSGGLVGQSTSTVKIKNCSASPNIRESHTAGGLVGAGGTIVQSSANGDIKGTNSVGGLIGSNSSEVIDSHAKGKITGDNSVGGLVGHSTPSGDVTNSYAKSDVQGENSVGGLVGRNNGGKIVESFAACQVVGVDRVGGLAGSTGNQGSVKKSYSVSKTTGESKIGGLIGQNPQGAIEMSFAAGYIFSNKTEEDSTTGGLIGELGSSFGSGDAVIKSSYWDETTTAQSEAVGTIVDDSSVDIGDDVVGFETTKLQGQAAKENMNTFNFNEIWDVITAPTDYPILHWQDEPIEMPNKEHQSGVDQVTFDAVASQNKPTDEVTFDDLVDGIQSHQDNNPINGVSIDQQDLLDLIGWYQN